MTASEFYDTIQGKGSIGPRELVALFVYYITEVKHEPSATAKSVSQSFKDCSLTPPQRIPKYLSEGLSREEYVKRDTGYALQRHYKETLATQLVAGPKLQSHPELRKLEARVTGPRQAFLKETLDCFEIGANRATILMCWLLVMDHLAEYVFSKHIAAFNGELAKVTDKRVKVSSVTTRDDFSEIPENKFIELMRSAKIISNDVRKILDEKLGIRNSSAHPSGIAIKPTKVVEFVDDLIENVVLKYAI